jgi:hypothetical protein
VGFPFRSFSIAHFAQIVTAEFLRSLGDCLLAGSLDVVHHHHILDPVTTPVRVRYLGAFLYLGGYLLLVKVEKGKVYRIKHWFSLAPFELVDIPQDAGNSIGALLSNVGD